MRVKGRSIGHQNTIKGPGNCISVDSPRRLRTTPKTFKVKVIMMRKLQEFEPIEKSIKCMNPLQGKFIPTQLRIWVTSKIGEKQFYTELTAANPMY